MKQKPRIYFQLGRWKVSDQPRRVTHAQICQWRKAYDFADIKNQRIRIKRAIENKHFRLLSNGRYGK